MIGRPRRDRHGKVPTVSVRLLYGLLILQHGRRQIMWLGVTAHPTATMLLCLASGTFATCSNRTKDITEAPLKEVGSRVATQSSAFTADTDFRTGNGDRFQRSPLEGSARPYIPICDSRPSSFLVSGMSVMVTSVSNSTLATDTAFSRPMRTTLVGSMMPASTKSTYSLRAASKP
jgi:hypothetical protein